MFLELQLPSVVLPDGGHVQLLCKHQVIFILHLQGNDRLREVGPDRLMNLKLRTCIWKQMSRMRVKISLSGYVMMILHVTGGWSLVYTKNAIDQYQRNRLTTSRTTRFLLTTFIFKIESQRFLKCLPYSYLGDIKIILLWALVSHLYSILMQVTMFLTGTL